MRDTMIPAAGDRADMGINRRELLAAAVATGGTVLLPAHALSQAPSRFATHRFGLNYVPSKNWYYVWNDWRPSDIARDLDGIAALGADHIRIMLVWPWFQPNPDIVSQAHLDRLDELMQLAYQRNLDVLVTVFTGWLSGYSFRPPYYQDEPFYTSTRWRTAQGTFLKDLSARLVRHDNFLGYDIGNEINDCWQTDTLADGDRWMTDILGQMNIQAPGRVHVNGVDNQPWFRETTFSPQALATRQDIVALHCWSYWTGAKDFGGPLDVPYTHLAAAMTALARAYAGDSRKPVWIEEFGACSAEMPASDVPRWLEIATLAGVQAGVSWFTWWASHDVERRFAFNDFEYDLGLLTTDNKVKPAGMAFRRLAEAHRGKAVNFPTRPLPPPPQSRTPQATWAWMLAWLKAQDLMV